MGWLKPQTSVTTQTAAAAELTNKAAGTPETTSRAASATESNSRVTAAAVTDPMAATTDRVTEAVEESGLVAAGCEVAENNLAATVKSDLAAQNLKQVDLLSWCYSNTCMFACMCACMCACVLYVLTRIA